MGYFASSFLLDFSDLYTRCSKTIKQITSNNIILSCNLPFCFLISIGGCYLPVGDERCTHLVVEESTVKEIPFEPLKKLYIVKQEVSASKFLKEYLYVLLHMRDSFSLA